MLLTLSARSMGTRLSSAKDPLSLLDLPAMGKNELGLQGLSIQTSFLKGWSLDQFDRLRDEADKAGCPCLLLVEEQPHAVGAPGEARARESIERMERVLRVANRLGCSSVAMAIEDSSGAGSEDLMAQRMKEIIAKAERYEMNLLVGPGTGATSDPEALTGLIRTVGGFRIGAYPDFQTAAGAPDPGAYLRSLTPYASVVCASFGDVDAKGKHKSFDIDTCLEAIASVGFEGSLSLECRGKGDPAECLVAMRDHIVERFEMSQSK